ncbi:transcriptional regulator [Anaerocolumna cellulosilytica]|uniref:Transcriptional regulator n=1 Tax=Anaerocolumna cellulosilytica TaxID=433286 RepID=A0A6S6QVK1_9FIRM|nr:DUF3267 domain-containing protein [Anaerocolumna cellulosilytica]MBB5196004.1 hypothetical protein [Anaerocolumna cellulosilytica]BCJ93696.1 transcriptional regulator [Anaerocolumna cellulosilytica]
MNQLPEGYKEIRSMNLQKNKKLAMLINAGALILLIAVLAFGLYFQPITVDLKNTLESSVKLIVVLALYVLYIIAHELVHGVFMKKFSQIKPHYGFTGLYAFAGSDAYFNKKHYIIISLAPIVLLGAVIAIINALVPSSWFWGIYFIQAGNISGAAGDIYVTNLIRKLPADILVQDSGVSMTIYSKKA